MPTIPTTIQQSDAIVYGSCKVEVSTDSGVTWTNVGAARSVVFNEQQTVSDIQSDNTEDIANYVSDHTVNITLNGLELYLPTLNKIRGGIDTLSATTGGVKTTDTDVYTTGSTAFSYGTPLYFVNQGDSTTLPAVTKVQGVDTGNSSDTLDTGDYTTFTDANNKSGIIVYAGGSFNDSESLRVTYTYETIPSRKMTSGGKSTISSRWYRLTNKQIVSGVDKFRYFVVYSASINAGLNLAFKSSYDEDPVLEVPISLIAKLDTTRSSGDQLFYIEDEVGVS